MIDLSRLKGIYVYCGLTDMRKGLSSLSVLISSQFGGDRRMDSLFLFCGKDRKKMKAVEFSEDGIWLYQKKLDRDRFRWPMTSEEKITLDAHQLERLLSGLSVITGSPSEEIRY